MLSPLADAFQTLVWMWHRGNASCGAAGLASHGSWHRLNDEGPPPCVWLVWNSLCVPFTCWGGSNPMGIDSLSLAGAGFPFLWLGRGGGRAALAHPVLVVLESPEGAGDILGGG